MPRRISVTIKETAGVVSPKSSRIRPNADEDVLACEDNEDETNTDSEEDAEEREEDSETDQDDESSGEDEVPDQEVYVGKAKVPKWSKTKPSARMRRRTRNILLCLPDTIGDARKSRSSYGCWNCINSEVINVSTSILDPKASRRRGYVKVLCEELCLEQLQRISIQTHEMPMELQLRLRQVQPTPQHQDVPSCHDGQRKRCTKCPEMKKVRYSRCEYLKFSSVVFSLGHAFIVCETYYKHAFQDLQIEPIDEG
ncbi:hypothetical protein AVEN_84003-1 [Araneus ventricosus]|uniref:PiggyBac transposable element-derived protein domain-containing protein n=1 Tax=Araneus ventricosus TaxID=182803 RepID=A0A4Y2BU97_ARAVE|nr:hypothetical protein AVEN_84003-1 [Araneus ventricosus]